MKQEEEKSAREEEFVCNGCLKEIRGNWKDKIIGLCQSCQDKFDKEIKRGRENERTRT